MPKEFEYIIVYFVSFYIYVLKQFKIVNLISKLKKSTFPKKSIKADFHLSCVLTGTGKENSK